MGGGGGGGERGGEGRSLFSLTAALSASLLV